MVYNCGLQRYPDGSAVGSDGPLWTRFAAASSSSSSSSSPFALEYVNGDRSPWIARGKGVFDNISKTFRGEWDAGMAFAFQGMLRGTSRSRQQQQLADLDVEGRIKACVNAGVPEGASALTHAAWRAGCADGAEFDELQQVRTTANQAWFSFLQFSSVDEKR